MPRKNSNNRLVKGARISEIQLECLVDCWSRGITPERSMEILDENFSPPKNSKHVMRREAVSNYFRDFGDYLWIVWGYDACIKLLNSVPDEYQAPNNTDSYPEIDIEVRQLIKTLHTAMLMKDPISMNISKRVLIAVSVLTDTMNGRRPSPAAFLLKQMFTASNGFTINQTHAYLARALAISLYLDLAPFTNDPQEKFQLIANACNNLKHLLVEKLYIFRLREPIPISKFPWANDGWSKYEN